LREEVSDAETICGTRAVDVKVKMDEGVICGCEN
jgi:hypothetical protein